MSKLNLFLCLSHGGQAWQEARTREPRGAATWSAPEAPTDPSHAISDLAIGSWRPEMVALETKILGKTRGDMDNKDVITRMLIIKMGWMLMNILVVDGW